MNKQLNKMIFVAMLGLLSANPVFAMLGPDESPEPLRNHLRQTLHGYTQGMGNLRADLDNMALRELGLPFQQLSEQGRLDWELEKHQRQLRIEAHQMQHDYQKNLLNRLEQTVIAPSFDGSDEGRNGYRQAVAAFNQFAQAEEFANRSKVREVDHYLKGVIHAGSNWGSIQAKKAMLTALAQRASGPNVADNKQNAAQKNSFSTTGKYITGTVVLCAVVGTAYFYGHRIKAWVADKWSKLKAHKKHVAKAPRK